MISLPALIVEVAFGGASTGTLLHLDDPTRGKLDTGTLAANAADDTVWTDITAWALAAGSAGSTSRGSTRVDGPLITYEAGKATILLDNSDRRFDPSNLAGPYCSHSGTFSISGAALNPNTGFESGTANWTGTGGTFTAATDQVFAGAQSGKIVPDGVSTLVYIQSDLCPVTAGKTYRATAWLRCAVGRWVNLNVNWFDSSRAYLSTSASSTSVPANAWINFASPDFTAPAGAAYATVVPGLDTTPPASNIVWCDQVGLYPSTDLTTQVTAMRAVRVRAAWAAVTYELFRGFADGWDVVWLGPGDSHCTLTASDADKVLTGIDRPAGTSIGASETTGARINRILDSASWPAADRNVATGDSTVQATTLSGQALSELQLTADSEIGELYVDGGGRVVFRNRRALLTDARSGTSQATFGDLTEFPYDDLATSTDDVTFYNQVRVTRAGGTEQMVSDATSIALFYPKTYVPQSQPILETDTEALSYAQWLLHISSAPELRFTSLKIKPWQQPADLYPQVLGREIGDRITVVRRPPGGGTITQDVFIRGVTHDFSDSAWTTTWTLQSAAKYGSFLTLDNPTLGVLDSNALAY